MILRAGGLARFQIVNKPPTIARVPESFPEGGAEAVRERLRRVQYAALRS